jgi:hypothetical protein
MAWEPVATDSDGLPNYWEISVGTNPNAANNNHTNDNGYTDLEQYLDWLAGMHAVGPANSFVEVNLRNLTSAMVTNAVYTVLNSTNGAATLFADGRTVRFTPATDFFGLGSFRFSAVDCLAGGAITNNVVLLITPPAPRFTNVSLASGNLLLSGLGWIPFNTYYLLASSNPGLPLAAWTRIATNAFDAAGNFNLTNALSPNSPQRFYRLQLQ